MYTEHDFISAAQIHTFIQGERVRQQPNTALFVLFFVYDDPSFVVIKRHHETCRHKTVDI